MAFSFFRFPHFFREMLGEMKMRIFKPSQLSLLQNVGNLKTRIAPTDCDSKLGPVRGTVSSAAHGAWAVESEICIHNPHWDFASDKVANP